MHDSVAFIWQARSKKCRGGANYVRCYHSLVRTTNMAVTPTPIYSISRISCPDVPLNSCQQVDCGLPRRPVSTHTGVKDDCVVASTYGHIGWSSVATPSPDRNSASASKHTYSNPFRITRNRVKWQPQKTIDKSPGRIAHSGKVIIYFRSLGVKVFYSTYTEHGELKPQPSRRTTALIVAYSVAQL